MAEEGFEFYGTRYAAGTVASRTAGGLWRNARSKGSLALAGVVALGQNLWQYGTDPTQGTTFWDRTVRNREFWVSTGVDFGISVLVGLAAAAVVAGAIALLAGTAVGTFLAMPAVAIVVTLGVSLGIGWGLDSLRVPDKLKAFLNNQFADGGK